MPFAIIVSLLGASLLYVVVQAVVVGAHPGLAQPSDTPGEGQGSCRLSRCVNAAAGPPFCGLREVG